MPEHPDHRCIRAPIDGRKLKAQFGVEAIDIRRSIVGAWRGAEATCVVSLPVGWRASRRDNSHGILSSLLDTEVRIKSSNLCFYSDQSFVVACELGSRDSRLLDKAYTGA